MRVLLSTVYQLILLGLLPPSSSSFIGLGQPRGFFYSRNGGDGLRVATTPSIAAETSQINTFHDNNYEDSGIKLELEGGISHHPPLIVVDVENVRGKSNFKQTHEELIAKACSFVLEGSNEEMLMMVLVVDHGANLTVQAGGPLSKKRVGIVFAGPGQKADDVIVALAASAQNKTAVVSSDKEVVKLCQHNSNVHILEPDSFLEKLNTLSSTNALFDHSTNEDNHMDTELVIQKEVVARQQIQMLDRVLQPRGGNGRSHKNMSRKKRTKLKAQREQAKRRLDTVLDNASRRGVPTLDAVVEAGDVQQLEFIAQGIEASKQQIRRGQAQTTYERQILAERLRRQLEEAGAETVTDIDGNENVLNRLLEVVEKVINSPVTTGQRFHNPDVRDADAIDGASLSAQVIRVPRHRKSATPKKNLRMVVISDTHGFEGQLFRYYDNTGLKSPYHLPEADVLIHCGDFHGNGVKHLKLFDQFLAAQTHIPTKIVVRGNHDPKMPGSILFPKSNALYVTKSMTLELDGGIIVALRPHSRTRNEAPLPVNCDILASHEPPYNVLDYTYSGQRAGSIPLRKSIDESPTKPCLMLSGHIHEGRGARWHTFYNRPPRPGSEHLMRSTYVVNAANANSGRARRLVNGPVVLELVDEDDSDKDKSKNEHQTADEGTETASNMKNMKFYRPDSLQALISEDANDEGKEVDEKEMARPNRLLSVDLGLRAGTAVFDEDGVVLSVDTWRFADQDDLSEGLNELMITNNVTHVVIEGEDRKLYNIWKNAIESLTVKVKLARVIADEWRETMLLPKEQRSSRLAKQAAGLIAKQLLRGTEHEGKKLSADASEALLIGKYAVRTMGWDNSTEPLVSRYMNGDVAK